MSTATNNMQSTAENTKEAALAAIKRIAEMKDSTAVVLIGVITFVILLIALCYYVYYSMLKVRECSLMNSIYGNI